MQHQNTIETKEILWGLGRPLMLVDSCIVLMLVVFLLLSESMTIRKC